MATEDIAVIIAIIALIIGGVAAVIAYNNNQDVDLSSVERRLDNVETLASGVEAQFRSDINTLDSEQDTLKTAINNANARIDSLRNGINSNSVDEDDLEDVEDDVQCIINYYDDDDSDYDDVEALQDCLGLDEEGISGIVGPQGPAGPTGPAGADGADGADYSEMTEDEYDCLMASIYGNSPTGDFAGYEACIAAL